ncbi:hypothetical protein [Herbaspirillum autotrophicum]|uniref:hypothetical protein n=1 Tax=Herbaspirillum autotrophicum TaxID=180195 RepID=UPI00067C53DB|nr:hypothetical protein [Herbaspirillum autotrophicum]
MSLTLRLFFARLALFGIFANMVLPPAAQAGTDVAAMAICSTSAPPPAGGHGPYSLSASHCQYCHAGNQPLPGLPSHQQLLIPDLTVRISPTANQEYAASSVQRADAQARAPPALMLHACHTA